MIPFNVPPYVGREIEYMRQAAEANRKISGDGPFSKRCHAWMEERFGTQNALLTTSGTSALEMSALLCDLQPGDEVILPSFTFSSTANAFILAGARLVFVDIRPDTMNIDERKIEAAITDRTRVICVVHYAGVSCEMDSIMATARKHGLMVVEDAAQGVKSTYKGRALGTIGDFGCLSFHETKNYSMGEGGALLIRDERHNEQAEILREKGTDRSKFMRGQVDKYTWRDYGSSYGINHDAANHYGENVCWYRTLPFPLDFQLYQTVPASKLKPGAYRVRCLLWCQTGAFGTCGLFANNHVQYFGKESDYGENLPGGVVATFAGHKGTSGSTFIMQEMEVTVSIEEGESLTLGICTSGMKPDGTQASGSDATGWFKVDHFRIERVKDGEDGIGKLTPSSLNQEEADDACSAAPDTILAADKRGIRVACGQGESVRIIELQAPGKKRMRAADYLLGHPMRVED